MSRDARISGTVAGPWSRPVHDAMTVRDDSDRPGNPVFIVVAGLVAMVLTGVLASSAGFGILASLLIGWAGSILGILVWVLGMAWACDRADRRARAATARNRQRNWTVHTSASDRPAHSVGADPLHHAARHASVGGHGTAQDLSFPHLAVARTAACLDDRVGADRHRSGGYR